MTLGRDTRRDDGDGTTRLHEVELKVAHSTGGKTQAILVLVSFNYNKKKQYSLLWFRTGLGPSGFPLSINP